MLDVSKQFPIYIPSKGRYEFMVTSKRLTKMNVPHNIIVEEQEYDSYKKAVDSFGLMARLIKLDYSFKEDYELLDEHGLSKSTGSGPARNCAWEHSISEGFKWHWIMDDNIRRFRRLNDGFRNPVDSGVVFKCMEDFVLRYKNISMAGPNYSFFAFGKNALKPFILNTKLYSCNLIRNDVPFRWRGRYNEDVILSLDMLKAGWCTVQFNAFLQEKMATQMLPGGNTQELYHADCKPTEGQVYSSTGTIDKSRMVARAHPDVAKVTWRFGRVHHHVNYNPFKKNKLVKGTEKDYSNIINEYGMVKVKDKSKVQEVQNG